MTDLISLRKREINDYKLLPALPNRIETDSPVRLSEQLAFGINNTNSNASS